MCMHFMTFGTLTHPIGAAARTPLAAIEFCSAPLFSDMAPNRIMSHLDEPRPSRGGVMTFLDVDAGPLCI